MADHRAELRRFIEAATRASEPITLDDIVDHQAKGRVSPSDEPETITPPTLELVPERPMSRTPLRRILTVAAALIAIGLVGVVWVTRDGSTDPLATSSSTDQPVSTTTEPPVRSVPAAQVARAYWEAIAASDLDAAVALIDPDSPGVIQPPGRPDTLAVLLDWYEVVGWEWQIGDCTDVGDGVASCDMVAQTAWSEALGLAPLTTTYRVRVGDDGITSLGFSFNPDDCCPGFNEFNRWVREMYPDEAEVMWGESAEPDAETLLRLFELNTLRFVRDTWGSPLGNIDTSSLRPLASLSTGDIVIPTAPPTWSLSGALDQRGTTNAQVFNVAVESGGPIEIWVGPCGDGASPCTSVDAGFGTVEVPTSVAKTINDVEWGYSGNWQSAVAALIGGHLVVVNGGWLELDVPLLDDPAIVDFLDGLRVGSPDELPEGLTP